MCGRYSVTSPPEAVRHYFGFREQPNFPPRYNIAPTQPVPIVLAEGGVRHFRLVRWGLVPSWSKEVPKTAPLINARAETVDQKPAFRGAFRHRRCLVPADGFYEWQKQPGGAKQPYLIRKAAGGPFAFAGIWEDWMTPEGSELDSCAIITTSANRALRAIHHRMPVILEPEQFDLWLDGGTAYDEAKALLKPAADTLLEAVPISTKVNRVANDSPEIQEPVGAGEAESSAAQKPPKAKKDNGQMDLF